MSEIKLVVIYPTPTNIDEFERLYTDEHLPFAGERLFGQTKAMVTTMVSTPDGGEPPFLRGTVRGLLGLRLEHHHVAVQLAPQLVVRLHAAASRA